MRTENAMRWAALAVLLAIALPAPASAQFGGLKRKLKEKIINAAVDGAANKALGPDTSAASSAAAPDAGTSAGASRPRASKSAQDGPQFSEYLPEITADVLERLQRAFAAEAAERKAIAAHPRKVLPREQYNTCKQKIIMQTPEGQLAFKEFRTAMASGNQDAMQKAGEAMNKRLDELALPRCGYDEIAARDLENQDQEKVRKVGLAASGLSEFQYAMVKERIVPFCQAAKAAGQAAASPRISAGAAGIFYVYAQREIEVMRPLCGKLLPLLEARS